MVCPYCSKEDFVPTAVIQHTKTYGGGYKNFRCLHCDQIINGTFSVQIDIADVQKINDTSETGGWLWLSKSNSD